MNEKFNFVRKYNDTQTARPRERGNVFVEASQTTAGGKSTTTATVGANSSIQSPSVGGVSVGTSTTIKASVTTSP